MKMNPDDAAARILSFLNSTVSWDIISLQSGRRLSTFTGMHFLHLRAKEQAKQAETLTNLTNFLS